MTDQSKYFSPDKITGPFQLLAACVILLIVTETSFLTGAATIDHPTWAAGLLVVCAVVNVPVILVGVFILQTRYRPELMTDAGYAELRVALSAQASQLKTQLEDVGFDLDMVVEGTTKTLTETESQQIDSSLETVLATLPPLEVEPSARWKGVPPAALLQTAKALLARRRWAEAAGYLDAYVAHDSRDWEVQFSRGLAHANARSGPEGDLQSLRAYGEAIALAPIDLDPELRARLHTYRGAMSKRLLRLREAEADLLIAEELSGRDDRRQDIDYNLAGVYALSGRLAEAMTRLQRLVGTPMMRAVAGHQHDYFASLRNDPAFRTLVASQP